MDVYFSYRGELFVWNGLKAIENKAKHGVSFETACEVFFDRQSTFVDASVPEESRLGLIGFSNSFALLFVVHLDRTDDAIRIVSAREATRQEAGTYENGG